MVKRKQIRGPGPARPAASGPSPAVRPRLLQALGRGRWWLAPVCVLLWLGLLYPEPLWQGQVYAGADTAAAEAFRQVGDAARQEGQYPLWNPYIFGGMPTFGSVAYTHGVYPPTVVFEGLQRLGLPPLTWMLGHLFFGGLGMWWLLGRWHVPWPARCLSVVIWLWSARLVAWAVHGHGTKLGAEMYLPWLVGLVWMILTRGGLRPVAWAALLLGLQFLRGHPQISYYTLLLLGLLTVWHLVWPLAPARADATEPAAGAPKPPWSRRWPRAGLVAVAVVLGFAIGAALLLPVHSYASLSTRGAGGAGDAGGAAFDYATNWSLAPEDLAAVFLPAVAGFGKATYMGRMPFTDNPNYIGFLVPLLAVAAWRWRAQRSLLWALAAVCGISLLLAMGRFSPGLYQFAYDVWPFFDKFRVPAMIMVLPVLAVAVLAGLGASALADSRQVPDPWLQRAAWALFGLGGLLLVAATGVAEEAHRSWLTALAGKSPKQAAPVLLSEAWTLHREFLIRGGLVLLAAGGAMLLAGRRAGFRRVWLVPVLVVLVAVDQGSVVRLVTHPERALSEVVRTADGGGRLAPASRLIRPWQGPATVQVDPALQRPLRDLVGHDRLLPLGADAVSNAYMTAGIRSAGGYYPAKPAAVEAVRQRLYDQLPAGRLARWYGVAAVTYPAQFTPADLDLLREQGLDLEPAGRAAGPVFLYRVADRLPRARLVDQWRPVTALPQGDALEPFLDAIAAGGHDPAALVVLDREPDPRPQTGLEALSEPEFVRDGLNEVVLRVEAPRPVLVLLADLWAPGWQAEIDGRPADLLRADLMLRAVAVPAGVHEVRFVYRDPAVRQGVALAVGGVLCVLVLWTAPWLARRRQVAVASARGESERD